MNEGKLGSFKPELCFGGFFPFCLIELQRNYGGYQEYRDKMAILNNRLPKLCVFMIYLFKRPILLAEFEL